MMDMITEWMGRDVDTFSREEAIAALKTAVGIIQTAQELRAFSREIKAYDQRINFGFGAS